MRSIVITALLVFAVVGLALNAQALTVYNDAGQAVADTVATAVALNPVPVNPGLAPGAPQNIKITAAIPSTLKVGLSATQIAWTVKQEGTYQAKAIDITCTGAGATDVGMTVAGAADLAKQGGTGRLAIKYALKPTGVGTAPSSGSYESASSFNGSHNLKAVSTDLNVSIWNKITVPNGTPASSYQNDFTVTFSQAL